ncbi:hypothetical protein TYRP_011960 [Tyrophagus putrescentiae]|nr:hypothetical protein TYRP_011960 [Tyrophagus putrescentiae]
MVSSADSEIGAVARWPKGQAVGVSSKRQVVSAAKGHTKFRNTVRRSSSTSSPSSASSSSL